jgi:hypothetical protein
VSSDRTDWLKILVNAGLAAAITAGAGLVGAVVARSGDSDGRECEIAVRYLRDETPTPYVDPRIRARMEASAAARFERCMKE